MTVIITHIFQEIIYCCNVQLDKKMLHSSFFGIYKNDIKKKLKFLGLLFGSVQTFLSLTLSTGNASNK